MFHKQQRRSASVRFRLLDLASFLLPNRRKNPGNSGNSRRTRGVNRIANEIEIWSELRKPMPRVAAPPDVKQSVLDAAIRLMERYGFKKMTMEAVAQEAGIGKATIYGYFENKEDVALSVIQLFYDSVKSRWRELASADRAPEERVRAMLVELVLGGFDRAQRCRQSMDETLAAFRSVILHRRYQFNRELAALLAVVLREGCECGRFQCADPAISAQALITGLSGLNPTNLSPRELGEREEIESRAHQVIDLMLSGLLARRGEPK
jgi:AcrR family transcriptional regulator